MENHILDSSRTETMVGSIIYLPTVDKSSSYFGSEANQTIIDTESNNSHREVDLLGDKENDVVDDIPLGGSFHPPTRVSEDTGRISPSLDHQILKLMEETTGDVTDMNFLRILLTDKRKTGHDPTRLPHSGSHPRCNRCINQGKPCKRCASLGDVNLAKDLSNASKLVFLASDNTTRVTPAYTSLIHRQEGEHGTGDCQSRVQSRNSRERPLSNRSASAGASSAALRKYKVQQNGWTEIDTVVDSTSHPKLYTPSIKPEFRAKVRAHTAKPASVISPDGVLLTESPSRRVVSANVIRARSGHLSSAEVARNPSTKMVERIKYESQERRIQRLEREQGVVRRPKSSKVMRRDRSQSNILRRGQSKDSSVVTAREKRLRARLRFRTAYKRVATLLRCMRCVVAISNDLTTRTAVEMQWHTLNTSKEARKLAFNPSLYAKSRAYAKLPKWSKRLLEKGPDERTESDCRRLHALLRGLRSFDKFTEKIQLAMCKSFTFQEVDAQRIILRKGHVGQNFYFIYSGSVFVNVEDVNAQGEKFVKTEVVLSKGDAFGELALLKDITRTATISCRETCELLVVDKEVFSQVCPRIFDLELEAKVRFLCNLALFHSKYWKHESIHNLCFDGHIQEYKTNKVVVLDSTKEEWMYICMEGQCRIIKCLALEDAADYEAPVLLKEDEMLTAEFLQVDNQAGAKRSGSRSGSNSARGSTPRKGSFSRNNAERNVERKKQMLQSLSLEYVSNKQEKDLLSRNAEEKRVEEHRKRAQQGVITLTNLIQQRTEENDDIDFVYLDIGTLNSGEVFDLADILRPPHTGDLYSCHILVSSGAKLLRVRKDTFHRSLSDEAKDHAKHIAMRNLYPSNTVLVKSYKEKAKWDRYKDRVVGDVMVPHMNQARRREIVRRINSLKEQTKQDERVVNTLQHGDDIDPETALLDLPEDLALEEKELIDHEDFTSKALREADQIKDRFHAVRRKADSAKAANRHHDMDGTAKPAKSAPPRGGPRAPSVIVEEEEEGLSQGGDDHRVNGDTGGGNMDTLTVPPTGLD